MEYLIAALVSYLIGSSNLAYYIARLKHIDLRSAGSGNLGASNTTILLGWKTGILVGIHDIAKSALAVYLAMAIFPQHEYIGPVAGVASVLGHIFPFYLKFKGGKGFASYLGMTLALNWKLALVVLALVILLTWLTDYIVAGTVTTIIVVPISMGIMCHSVTLAVILLIGTAVIAYKHKENFVRIYHGTEIGFKSTNKGKHRIDK